MDKEAADLIRKAVADVLNEVRQVPQPQNAHQTITLHHADPPPPTPWHSWACLTACIVSFVITCGMGLLFVDLSRRYDRLEDYLQVIYSHAPYLKELNDGRETRKAPE